MKDMMNAMKKRMPGKPAGSRTLNFESVKAGRECFPLSFLHGQALGVRFMLTVILMFSLIFLLSSCSRKTSNIATVVTIWDVSGQPGTIVEESFAGSSRRVQKQRSGFIRGLQEYPKQTLIDELIVPENSGLGDSAKILADIYSSEDVLLTVGASCDLHTMYAAMTNAFFNIPILIPFSDGDLVTDTGAEYSMRMAPVTQKYADYVGSVLFPPNTKQVIDTLLFENKPLPDYEINTAVFFADNFNGHDTSVKITQKLMDNGLDVDYYRPYPTNELLSVFNTCWNEEKSTLAETDVLLIIGEDMDELPDLGRILDYWDTVSAKPIVLILGYAPGYSSNDVWAEEHDNLFVIRQYLDMSKCPSDIINHEEAVGYAAGYVTQKVLDLAMQSATPEPSGWQIGYKTEADKQQIHQNYVADLRSKVFSSFMSLRDDIPCFGKPMFDTSSSDRRQLELVQYIDMDQVRVCDTGIIQSLLIDIVRNKTGLSE